MNARIGKKLVNVVTLISFMFWNLAIAAPEGGSVAAGSAIISQNGTLTTVNQSSQNTVINWNSFNTTSNETVQFNQPNASSIALNRINNGLPTEFAGALKANGNVWVLNPAGVLFTSTAKVDVAGLLATTHAITDANFMSGHYQFSAVPSYEFSKIINNGMITVADTGMVALVAPGVENNGIIQANLGKVALASGTAFVLDMYGDGLINFGNNAPAQSGYVKNAGKIIADGGKVYLTANSAAQAVDSVINMSGVIEAKSVSSSKGSIILHGGKHGKVKVSGKLDTSNVDSNGMGGFIETSGETLDVALGAVNPGKGGTWSVDPTVLIIDTNPVNGDWVDQIQNSINSSYSISLAADMILVMEPINASGYCGAYCYPTLYLTAYNLLDVLASISLNYANLNLYSYGILQTSSLATLSTYGSGMYLYGGTLTEIDGPLSSMYGSMAIYGSGNVILGPVTANYGAIDIRSYGGDLTLNGEMNVSNQDYVYLYANNNVNVNAPIVTNNAYLEIGAGYSESYGNLTINSGGAITATNNDVYLFASNSVEINAPISIHGGNLNVYAYGWDYGQITINAPILLDTILDGDMYLWAWNEIDLNNTITLTDGGFEAVAVYGDVNVYSAISASNYLNLYAGYNVYSEGMLTVTDGGLNAIAGYCYYECSDYGHVMLNAPVSATNGNTYIYAPNSITTNGTITVENGGLEYETDYYSIHINGEINITGDHNAYFEAYAGGSVHIDAPITVMNSDGYFCGDYAMDIEAGQDNWWGKIYVNYPVMLTGGDAYFYAPNNIYVNDQITVVDGGLDVGTGFSGGSIYIDAPLVADDYVYINSDSSIYVNAGITVNDGYVEFETSYWGKIYINTEDPIISAWNQYYDDRVSLGTNVTLTSTFGNIYFDRAIDTSWCADPADLMINVLNGFVKFKGDIGNNNPLNNLIINGMTKFWNWCDSIDVVTWLSQIYNGPVIANTDVALVGIQNGLITLDSGYSAPDNGLYLIIGADNNPLGYAHGNMIDVGFLLVAGAGNMDLFNTTINGIGGPAAFGQLDNEGAGTHLCVNGVGIGVCSSFIPLDQVTSPQIFTTPVLTVNGNNFNFTMTDADGNTIEMCTQDGCIMNIVKNPS